MNMAQYSFIVEGDNELMITGLVYEEARVAMTTYRAAIAKEGYTFESSTGLFVKAVPGDDYETWTKFWVEDTQSNKCFETLEELNTQMTVEWVDRRPDGLMAEMPAGTNHWLIYLSRMGATMKFYFSTGPAITEAPTLLAVLESLCMDWTGSEISYQEFCATFDYALDDYSRRVYDAIQRQSADLVRLFGDYGVAQLGDLVEFLSGQPLGTVQPVAKERQS